MEVEFDTQRHASAPSRTTETSCTSIGHPKAMWQSAWLYKQTLIAFIFLLTFLLISLFLLWRYDVTHHGIRLTLSSNHYIWTYGPTAILVGVASIWRQIDYQCKSAQPWLCMQDRVSSAEDSVLMDYISPLQITSFCRAASKRHWPVLCSVLGFATLKIIVLASTSLLLPSDTLLAKSYDARLLTSFDASWFWETIPLKPFGNRTSRGIIKAQLNAHESAYANVSTDPVSAYWSLSRSDASYPLGTKDGLAFQVFEATNADEAIKKLSMPVDTFVPNVTCEVPKWARFRDASGGPDFIQLELDTQTCSVGRGKYDYDPFTDTGSSVDVIAVPENDVSCPKGCWPYHLVVFPDNDVFCPRECLPYPSSFTIQRVNCADPSNWKEPRALNNTTPHDFRFAVIAANLSTPFVYENGFKFLGKSVLQAAVVLCNIDYNIIKAMAVQDLEGGTYSIPGEYKGVLHGQHLPGLSGLELSELVYATLCEAAALRASFLDRAWGLPDSDASAPFFTVMASHLNNSNWESFFDTAVLRVAAENTFAGIASQLMQQSFLQQASILALSEGVYQEVRLHVSHISLGIMAAGFLVLTLVTAMITLTATGQVISQDPRSTATHASILAASPSLQSLLHESGRLRTSELKTLLARSNFRTAVGERFRIVAFQREAAYDCPLKPQETKTGTWLPLSARLPFVALTLTLPVMAIGALEILYRISIAHKGLAEAPADFFLTSSGVRLLSSLVILLIVACFNSLDFTVITFAPFGSLRNGAASASRGMLANLQGVTPLLVLYHSVKHGQFGVALSTLATLVGSLLTIFGSGLWVLNDRVIFDSNVTTVANHTWNLTPSNASIVGIGAAQFLDDVIRGVASLPSNVWNDLVFPNISEIALSTASTDFTPGLLNTAATNFTLTVPALRPELDCDTIPSQMINTTIGLDASIVGFEAHWDLPTGCYGGPDANRTYTKVWGSLDEWALPTWYGTFNDVHMGPWNITNFSNSEFGEGIEGSLVRDQADNPLGCPSIVAVFGYFSNLSHPVQNNITILVCNQKIQQVETKVVYLGDPRNGVISLSQPPITNESTATYLTNGTESIYAFNYRIEYDLTWELAPFAKDSEEIRIDNFFNHIIHGPTGIPREELLGLANAPRLLEAIQSLYKRYMVHVISRNFSQPIESPGLRQGPESRVITGTATRETERLTVDYPSKLALQITLAIMVILSGIAFRLANLRGTLPRNPCSIASVMGFLAGSELCSSRSVLPEGAEWMSLGELEKSLDGYFFSLGWWKQQAGSTDSETGNNSVNMNQNDISQQANMNTRTRFGIDMGTPLELGYRGKEA